MPNSCPRVILHAFIMENLGTSRRIVDTLRRTKVPKRIVEKIASIIKQQNTQNMYAKIQNKEICRGRQDTHKNAQSLMWKP